MKSTISSILMIALVFSWGMAALCGFTTANTEGGEIEQASHDHSTHSHSHDADTHGEHDHGESPASNQDDNCCASIAIDADPAVAVSRSILIIPAQAIAFLEATEVYSTLVISRSVDYKSNAPTGPPIRGGLSYYLLYQHLLI